MAPLLGYWKVRGFAQPIRLLLVYTATDFEEKIYDYGPDNDRSCWLNEKDKLGLDFPNLPYYIDGDVKLTQSSAILRYIARKHNLDGVTEDEKTKVDLMEYEISDYKMNGIRLSFNPKFDELLENYLKDLDKELKSVSQYLGKNKFLAGDNVTYVDFMAYEYLSFSTTIKPGCLKAYQNLTDYMARIEALNGVSQFLANSEAAKYPFHVKEAIFGGGH